MPSPIITASRGSRPTASAASSSRSGAGLPIESGVDPGRGLERGDDGPGARPQPALGRVDRVAVRGDEPGAGADAVGGGREPQRRSGSGPARRRPHRAGRRPPSRRWPPGSSGSRRAPAVTTSSPTSRSSRSRPPAPSDEHAPDRRLVVAQVERGRPRRGDDAVRRDRRAHRREPGRRSRRGSASSCS